VGVVCGVGVCGGVWGGGGGGGGGGSTYTRTDGTHTDANRVCQNISGVTTCCLRGSNFPANESARARTFQDVCSSKLMLR